MENKNKIIIIVAVLIPFLLVVYVGIFMATDVGSGILKAFTSDKTSTPVPTPTQVEDVLCGLEVYQANMDTDIMFVFEGWKAKSRCFGMISENKLPIGYGIEELTVEEIEQKKAVRTLRCGLMEDEGNNAFVYAGAGAGTEAISIFCRGMHMVESP